MPPGKYVFRVIARNSAGVWNRQGKSLSVVVRAPFYKTIWFATLVFAGELAFVALAWRYRVAQLEHARAVQQAFSRELVASQENERRRIAAELHDSIGQRLVVINNLALFSMRDNAKSRNRDAAHGWICGRASSSTGTAGNQSHFSDAAYR